MIIGKLRYWDLGREKAKGEFEIIAKDEEEFNEKMYREFRKHLISSDIGFRNGTIFAGFHAVGKFEFIAQKEQVKINE